MGGENIVDKPNILAGLGSSPRGRGKRARVERVSVASGLIPAWAGKTGLGDDAPGIYAAHPRVGGENPVSCAGRKVTLGSSPRGRGKPRLVRWAQGHAGLIPAWAGKTSASIVTMTFEPAHPRVGGENWP